MSGTVSMSSVDLLAQTQSPSGGTPIKQNHVKVFPVPDSEPPGNQDLYQWMARQQDNSKFMESTLHEYPSIGHESMLNTVASEISQDDTELNFERYTFTALQLADAQVLFKPLLKAIGLHLEGVKISPMMQKFGGNLSVKGKLVSLRIDIAEAENVLNKRSTGKGKSRSKKLPRFHIDTGLAQPAFHFDTFVVTLGMKDIVDFEKEPEDMSHLEGNRKSVRALKYAMDKLEAKPTTTQVNFSVLCAAITQHVNMPLLRLIHQFVTMIENIKETKTYLKQKRKDEADFRTHRKQDSKGSSGSADTQSTHSESQTPGISPVVDQEGVLPSSSSLPYASSTPGSETKMGIPIPPAHLPTSIPKGDMMPEQSRPDKLNLGASHGKSPKKFSFKKGKLESLFKTAAADMSISPLRSFNLSDSVAIDVQDTSSPALAEKTIVDEIKENTPKCWRTLYHLLALYTTMPETKTIGPRRTASRLSVIAEEPEKDSSTASKRGTLKRGGALDDMEKGGVAPPVADRVSVMRRGYGAFTQSKIWQ